MFAQRHESPWEKNRELIGRVLYCEHCIVCHDIDKPQKDSKKLGPSFYRLFQHERMPVANQPPNRAYILTRVRFGGSLMLAFRKKMPAAEIETLILRGVEVAIRSRSGG